MQGEINRSFSRKINPVHFLYASVSAHMPRPDSDSMSVMFRYLLLLVLLVPALSTASADLKPFSSDGCSLFPDGTITDRGKWCDCCLTHDIAYWQGGTKTDRKKADLALHACVLARTQDKLLADAMYAGVRAGGHPAFPNWYRWAYGWQYRRWYKALSAAESASVQTRLDGYFRDHPDGYCEEHHPDSEAQKPARPAVWAQPMASQYLRNLYRLDDKVFRSAQPDKKGFRELKALGIRNILNLRDFHSDDEGKKFGLRLYRVKMEAGDITMKKVIEALRIIRKSNGPVLIHCWHGSDRTGLVSAMYRIVFQGWSKDDAIDELMHGSYGYHALYRNIPEFIRNADIGKIKQAVLSD